MVIGENGVIDEAFFAIMSFTESAILMTNRNRTVLTAYWISTKFLNVKVIKYSRQSL
jgi:hypothetical protein